MKAILLAALLVPMWANADVHKSLTKMYCTGYADAVHTAIYKKGPSDKILAQYALECERNPNQFIQYMEVKAMSK